MDDYTATDILEMGLMEKNPGISTETVFLRNLTKRSILYDEFTEATKDDEAMNGVEWGREAIVATDGVKCNANIVLCSVGAKIPATGTTEAVVIAPNLQFPKNL